MAHSNPAGGYEDWISNLTEEDGRQFLECHECRTYIVNAKYWKINGEILCDDCARAMYQFGVDELDYEGL